MSSAASTRYTSGWRAYRSGSPSRLIRMIPSSSAMRQYASFSLLRIRTLFLACQFRGIRVFDDGSQRGVSQHESARPSPSELMSQQTESVGVPFEVCQVFPFVSFQHVLQLQALSFGKVCSDASRRNGRTAGCRDRVPDKLPKRWILFGDMGVLQFRMLL